MKNCRDDIYVEDTAPDMLTLLVRCKPWLEQASSHFKKCGDPECPVCAQNRVKLADLTTLLADIAKAEALEKEKA